MTDESKSVKAVIFDMGGVLLRTEDPAPRSRLAERFGLTRRQLEMLVFQSDDSIEAEKGLVTEDEHWQFVAKELRMDPIELPAFIDQYWAGDRLDQDLIKYIQELHSTLKTGLLSNAWAGARDSISRRFVFFEAFDQVIFSAEVGMRKPDKAIFDLMLDRLGVSAGEAVFVDDFRMNIEGARAAGLKAVHFKEVDQAIAEIKTFIQ